MGGGRGEKKNTPSAVTPQAEHDAIYKKKSTKHQLEEEEERKKKRKK